jgi:hypothetical protein
MTSAGVMELGAGCVLAVLPHLVTLTKVGAVHKGEGWWGKISCWVPACQLDRPPTTQEGEARWQGGVVTWQTCTDPSDRGGVGPKGVLLTLHTTLASWWGGWGWGEGGMQEEVCSPRMLAADWQMLAADWRMFAADWRMSAATKVSWKENC